LTSNQPTDLLIDQTFIHLTNQATKHPGIQTSHLPTNQPTNQPTNLSSLEPTTDAVEVESMIAHPPSNLQRLKIKIMSYKLLNELDQLVA